MRTRLISLLSILVLTAAVAAQSPPPPIHVAPVVPPAFLLLADPAVQQEIALRGDQKTAADRVRLGWSVPARGLHLGRFGKVPADSLRAAANTRTASFLENGLTKEQRTRLDQILFQLREKEFGSHQALVMAARDLGLRADQMEDVRTLKTLRVEEIDKAVTSGKRFEKVKVEVQATNGDTYDRMAEMLTRAQRERLKDLRGKPFEARVEPVQGKAAAVKAARSSVYPHQLFGVYDFEVRYLTSGAVRSELGIAEDQMPPIHRELDAWEVAFTRLREIGQPETAVEEAAQLHDQSKKLLESVLTPKQRERFDQLMVQRRLAIGGREAACGYPPVVAALKLTPIQLKSLKEGKSAAEVLAKSDLEALDRLSGRAFELSPYVSDPLRARAAEARALEAKKLQSAPVAVARDFLHFTNRLGLSDDQIKKLRELAEDEPKIRELIHKELSLEDTPPIAGSGRALTSERAVTEHYRQAVEQQCWDTLDPAQQSIARKLFGRGR